MAKIPPGVGYEGCWHSAEVIRAENKIYDVQYANVRPLIISQRYRMYMHASDWIPTA